MTVVQEIRTRKTIDFIYNPDNQSKAELIDGFVVRQRKFARLFSDIKEATMESPEQHYVIEGKRGMGKTTMLLRLAYAIENDDALNSWLMPIMFNEEEYSIRKLYKLWERIAILLEEKDDTFSGLFDEMDQSFKSYQTEVDYERGIYKLLNQKLEAAGKKLVLFIDNFGDIFSKFGKQEVQQLRTVLQTTTNFRIFAASSAVLEIFYDYKHPFYEYFKISRLSGLNAEETKDLLLKLGELYGKETIKDIIENEPGRIEALRRLTGGVIRTIVLLFEIFVDQKNGSAFNDLEALLDRVTPLYKHRMDNLPAQQQEIVEALALEWDAINVSEISQKTRIPSKTVSAQLRQMEKNEIITKKMTSIKNHYYQISERFFNIWYLMRHGRKGDKNKVVWLVRFLEEWCSEDELIERAEMHMKSLMQGDYDAKAAYLMTEALAGTKDLPLEKEHILIKTTRSYLNKKNSEWEKELSKSDIELRIEALSHFEAEEYNSALACLFKIKKGNSVSNLIGYCYKSLNDYPKAIEYFSKAIKKDADVQIMIEVALIFDHEYNDFSKAEIYYKMAANKGSVAAMFDLASKHNKRDNLVEAMKYYKMAAEHRFGKAMNNLATIYHQKLKNYKEAEKYYKMAVNEGVDLAIINLGILYRDRKDFVNAIKYFKKSIKKGNVKATFNLALLYHDLMNFSKAKKYYLEAIKSGDVEAMFNLGLLYQDLKDLDNAEKYYSMASENDHNIAKSNLAAFYLLTGRNRKKALSIARSILEKSLINADNIIKYSSILLWNEKVIESQLKIWELLDKGNYVHGIPTIKLYFLLSLAKNQYKFLYDYFTNPKAKELNIKEQFKPIWYTLMYYMQDEHPNEYLRMGSELEETVKEIIEQVEQMRIDYA